MGISLNIGDREMIEIKKLNKEMLDTYFDDILKLKNYSSGLHFKNDLKINEFNKSKLNDIYKYLQEDKVVLFVALDTNKLVGYVWGYPHVFFYEKRMYVNSLVVDEKYSGNGIGRNLLKTLEQYAKENDFIALDLNVSPQNEKAVHLYKKMNFEIERYQMRKELKNE